MRNLQWNGISCGEAARAGNSQDLSDEVRSLCRQGKNYGRRLAQTRTTMTVHLTPAPWFRAALGRLEKALRLLDIAMLVRAAYLLQAVEITGPRRCANARFSPANSSWFALSSLDRKNNPLRARPKSPLQIPPSRPEKRGVGHRHERWGGLRWTRQRQAREVFAGRLIRERTSRADERRLNAFAMASAGGTGWLKFWRRKLRTAKPCGSGTRGWCQAGGGLQSSTGRCEPSIRWRWRQEEFVSRESSA